MEIKRIIHRINIFLFNFLFILISTKDYLYTIPLVYNIEAPTIIYPTIVSVVSILEKSIPESKYNFYLLTNDSNIDNSLRKQMFTEIANKYKNSNFNNIDFSKIKSKYPELKGIQFDPLYYILFLSDYLQNEDKIIYLHGDTIALEDLNEMMNIDIGEKLYMGFLDYDVDGVKYLNIDSNNYINTGVMIVNLKKLKETNMIKEYLKFIQNNTKIVKKDETVINAVNYQNIGLLPPRFGLLPQSLKKMNKLYQDIKTKYDFEEYKSAINDPALLHYCGEPKPWNILGRERSREWWFFVNKTYYSEFIYSEYGSFLNKKKTEKTRMFLVISSIICGIAIIIYYLNKMKKISNS